jgi:hypothetical protein
LFILSSQFLSSQYFAATNTDPSNQVQNGLIKIARTGLYKIDFTGTYYTSVVADDYDASQWSIPTSKSVGYSLLRNGQEIATSFNVESGDMPNVSGTAQELSNTINF